MCENLPKVNFVNIFCLAERNFTNFDFALGGSEGIFVQKYF